MKMQLESADVPLISAYGPGLLAVDGVDYRTNLLITGTRVVENWFDGPLDTLGIEHFGSLLEDDQQAGQERAEILLLGTGADHVFPPMRLMAELGREGIALEVMNTRAACRTYSVLVNEARPVAAALLQIQG